MVEREISHQEVLDVVTGIVSNTIIASDKDNEVDLIYGKVSTKYLMVAINRLSLVIVTVRPMRQKERQFYEEAIR